MVYLMVFDQWSNDIIISVWHTIKPWYEPSAWSSSIGANYVVKSRTQGMFQVKIIFRLKFF